MSINRLPPLRTFGAPAAAQPAAQPAAAAQPIALRTQLPAALLPSGCDALMPDDIELRTTVAPAPSSLTRASTVPNPAAPQPKHEASTPPAYSGGSNETWYNAARTAYVNDLDTFCASENLSPPRAGWLTFIELVQSIAIALRNTRLIYLMPHSATNGTYAALSEGVCEVMSSTWTQLTRDLRENTTLLGLSNSLEDEYPNLSTYAAIATVQRELIAAMLALCGTHTWLIDESLGLSTGVLQRVLMRAALRFNAYLEIANALTCGHGHLSLRDADDANLATSTYAEASLWKEFCGSGIIF